ncbi:hypothetical protein [uncultured Corynebacterium sp.]|uniref:hypothetical protein n=2 Tax=Corynebacterium TaxID=1716 RepID=UPI0025DF269E|nr:hypothetical protein [uncultured Corynebacterium sp.]
MTTFQIDTEHTRRLAHELADAAQASPTPPPALPTDPTLSGFITALEGALSNLDARLAQVRADATAVAESSFRMAREAEDSDDGLAAALGGA